MTIFKLIESEIYDYQTKSVSISEGYEFSEWQLKKRILIYANKYYPEGKQDSQGNYKYWFDKIGPVEDAEKKNIDFDTKDILIYTDPPSMADLVPLFLSNAKIKKWLRDTGQGIKINDAIEDSGGWGNYVWKKVKGGYEGWDPMNFYVINQSARTLDETSVIERHEMSQSDLRNKKNVWKIGKISHIDNVIKNCGVKSRAAKKDISTTEEQNTEFPIYEIYERNGEISLKDLKEARGEALGKDEEDIYVLAKIVLSGLRPGEKEDNNENKYVLYAEKLTGRMSDIYKEYHRGKFKGRWWREGLIELLFDHQTRYNEISNEIARALDNALKILLKTPDKLIAQNILTDLLNGDIIKTTDINQIIFQVPAIASAIQERNQVIQDIREISNSYEVVQGENLPSGTPFRLGAMMNLNANKLFEFLREKLGLALEAVIGEWVMPGLLSDLKSQEVMELTGDREFMGRYYETIAKSWYIKNLIQIGPHTKEQADLLIQVKIKELQNRPMALVKYEKEMFANFKPKVKVVITGENIRISQEMESWGNFIKLENDLVRRSAMIEKAMALALPGVDVAGLPKSTPEQLAGIKMPVQEMTTQPATR